MAAAWPRSISRKCACKIPKGNMGYDQYTVCNDCSCRTYFLLLSFVLANIWRYARVSFTLGARDFSSAVSGFCQVFIVTRAKRSCVGLRPTPKFPPYAKKASGTQGMCHSFKFLWRTVQSKPPTITFVIVACTFFDNLSWNSVSNNKPNKTLELSTLGQFGVWPWNKQNRNNRRTGKELFVWSIDRIQTRVAIEINRYFALTSYCNTIG